MKFGCFSCKQNNDNDENINKKNNIFKGGYFKFKGDDSYNHFILYLNQIIGNQQIIINKKKILLFIIKNKIL